MRVTVIGAGALGTYFAARLAACGTEVSVVARGARLAAIRTDGLRLTTAEVTTVLPVPATADPRELPVPDLAVIAVKTQALAEAIVLLAPLASPRLAVLTLQNGVEAPDLVAEALRGVQVLAGRVHGFFERKGDTVRHLGVAPALAFGALTPWAEPAAARLAETLAAAGIAFTRPADMAAALWEKLVLASSLGGLGAALEMPVGAIRDNPAHAATLTAAMEEVAAVARARGVALPADCVARTLAFVGGFPAEATTSLHRDLAARRPSEFDHLTGAVPRLAAAVRVPVPVHTRIIAQLAAHGMI